MAQSQQPERFSATFITGSPFGFYGGGILGVVVGAGLIVAALIAPGHAAGVQMVFGAVLIVLFGAFLFWLPRLLKSKRRDIVVFSPEGAFDVRAVGRPLPWSSITSVNDHPTPRGVMLVLDSTPEALAAAEPTMKWARTMRSVEYGVSRSALVIYPIGLTAKPNELRQAAEAFWAAYRDDHPAAGGPGS